MIVISSDPTTALNPIEGDVPSWPAYDNENTNYMRIDKDITIAADFTREYSIAKDENFGL
jgi:carboxylesterase type B